MRALQGFNIGGPDAGPVFTGEQDDTCQHINENGQQCIRPAGHTEDLHFYPEPEEETS